MSQITAQLRTDAMFINYHYSRLVLHRIFIYVNGLLLCQILLSYLHHSTSSRQARCVFLQPPFCWFPFRKNYLEKSEYFSNIYLYAEYRNFMVSRKASYFRKRAVLVFLLRGIQKYERKSMIIIPTFADVISLSLKKKRSRAEEYTNWNKIR